MASKTAEVVALRAGPARLELLPAAGGSITRYCWEIDGRVVEWLRPNSGPGGPKFDPLAMASFPLVPFSSRIRDGRFTFQDRLVELPLNFLPERHTIHGQGWQAPWTLASQSDSTATIEYRHQADAWPWDYHARQSFALLDGALKMAIEVTNRSRQDMPVGIGFHPYFVRTREARVTAKVAAMWLYDSEVMPLRHLTPPPGPFSLDKGVVAEEVAMDNTFTGWDGRARIDWPERRASLTLTADPLLQFLVVFTPPSADFFCVEPVSNWTDAFNSPAEDDSGARVLAPGESLAATALLEPRLEP